MQLSFLKTEHLGASETDRKAIFDLYCENDKGEKFTVELHKANGPTIRQKFFKDRSLYYSTFAIQEQALAGDWDYQLKTVYTVAVMDFPFDNTDASRFYTDVRLRDGFAGGSGRRQGGGKAGITIVYRRQMKREGFSPAQIALLTGLSDSDIMAL